MNKLTIIKASNFKFEIQDYDNISKVIVVNLLAGIDSTGVYKIQRLKTGFINTLETMFADNNNNVSCVYLSLFGLSSLCAKTNMIYKSQEVQNIISSTISQLKDTFNIFCKWTIHKEIELKVLKDHYKTDLEVGIRPFRNLIEVNKLTKEKIDKLTGTLIEVVTYIDTITILEQVLQILEMIGYNKLQLISKIKDDIEIKELIPEYLLNYLPTEEDRDNLEAYTKLETYLC